jgi:hypothetical protein
MPAPGYNLVGRIVAIEALPSGGSQAAGSIFTDMYYTIPPAGGPSGTIYGTVTGSVLASVIQGHAVSVIASAQVVGFSQDVSTIIGARVLGVGKGLGSLIGTTGSTVIADTNTMLVQMYRAGTLAVAGAFPTLLVTANTWTVGTLVIQETGR